MKSPKKPERLWKEVGLMVVASTLMYFGSDSDWRWPLLVGGIYSVAVLGQLWRHRRFVACGGEAAAAQIIATQSPHRKPPLWVYPVAGLLFAVGLYFAWGNKVATISLCALLLAASVIETVVRDRRYFAQCRAASAEQS